MIVPSEAQKALSVIKAQLAEQLVAVYLHGSAVAGGLRPHSDVDLIAVINQPMTPETRQRLVAGLLEISGRYPFDSDGRRPLEVIIFLRADLTATHYPARSEFIYGEWLRNDYETGVIPRPFFDPELTLVLAQARQKAKTLSGPDANDLLPVISKSDIRRAIKDVLPTLIASQEGDERNVLLTLARMWRTLVTGDFVPKDIAADWAVTSLPPEQAAVITDAREAYLGGRENDWKNRQQDIRSTIDLLHNYVFANLSQTRGKPSDSK